MALQPPSFNQLLKLYKALGLSTGIPTLQYPPPLFLSLFTIALPRITFAHGTSPFTQEQFKAGRAGENKGWNGHGLKVDLHQFLIFGYLSWKFSLLSTAKI